MADIATLTVKYQSEGYDKVKGEVESLSAAGAAIERTGVKAAQAAGGIDKAAQSSASLATESAGVSVQAVRASDSLGKFIERLERSNSVWGKTNLQLVEANLEYQRLATSANAAEVALARQYASTARLSDAIKGVGSLFDRAITPMQRYERQLENIALIEKAGAKTAQEAAAARALALKEMQAASSGAEKYIVNLSGVFKHAIGGLIAYAALGSVLEFVRSIGDANLEMQKMLNTLNAASGSMSAAKSDFGFLSDLANKLGTDLKGSADGYARLAVSARDAGINTRTLHTAFEGLSEGFAATGRSGDEMNRFLVQLEQGLSQGTIQMRDLRAMAQSFPSAFEIAGEAAQRMGGSLQSFLKEGGLPAEQFFIAFSQIVHEKFAKAAEEASNTFIGQMNKLKNSLFEIKAGDAFIEPVVAALKELNEALKDPANVAAFKSGISSLGSLFAGVIKVAEVLVKNINLIFFALQSLATVVGFKALLGIFGSIESAAVKAASAISTLTSSTSGLSLSARAGAVSLGGLTPIIAGVTIAVIALFDVIDNYISILGESRDATDKTVVSINEMTKSYFAMAKQISSAGSDVTKLPRLDELLGLGGDVRAKLADVNKQIDDTKAKLAEYQSELKNDVILPGGLGNALISGLPAKIKVANESLVKLQESADLLNNLLPRLDQSTQRVASMFGDFFANAVNKAADSASKASGPISFLKAVMDGLKGVFDASGTASGIQALLTKSDAMIEKNKELTQSELDRKKTNLQLAQSTIDLLNAQASLAGITPEASAKLKDQAKQLHDSAQAADDAAKKTKKLTDATGDYIKKVEQENRLHGLTGVALEQAKFNETPGLTDDQRRRGNAALTIKGDLESDDEENKKRADALKQLTDLSNKYGVAVADLQRKLNGETQAQIAYDHAIIAAVAAYEKAGGAASEAAQKALEAAVANANAVRELSQNDDPFGLDKLSEQYDRKNPITKMVEDLGRFEAGISDAKTKLESLADGPKKDKLSADLKDWEASAYRLKSTLAGAVVGATEQAVRGLQSMTKQGTKQFAELEIAADSLAVTHAILDVLSAGSLPPPAGFVSMAAMAATVIPLLAQIGQSISFLSGPSDWGSQTAESRQASQGTGTVLGDANAQSESIAKAMDITASATSKLVGINTGMLRALQTLQQALGAAGTHLARGAADATFPSVAGSDNAFNNLIGKLDPFGGDPLTKALNNFLFGGKKNVIDQGIVIAAGTIGDMLNQIVVGAYQTIHKNGGLFGSSKTYDNVVGVSGEFTKQFQLVIGSIVDTVKEAAKALGIPLADIQAKIDAFKVAETHISLKDLSAEDQQKALEAVFSSIFDGLAGAVVPFIGQFQKVGEGLGETLVRVATEVQVMQQAIKYLGLTVNETDPEKFAQIADGMVGLFGSLDDFISAMQSFNDKFAPQSYKDALNLENLNSAFEQVGLTLPATRDGMWELMQSLDASTESGREQIAALLRLAGASDAYYDSIEEGAKKAADATKAAKEAAGDYADTVLGLLNELNANPLGKSILDIAKWSADTTNKLNDLAKAAGMAGARTEDLALVQQVAAARMAAAIDALYSSSQALVDKLYGTHDAVTEATKGVNGFSAAMGAAAEAAKGAIDLLLGDLSPYTDRYKLDLAKAAYAAGKISEDQVLEIGRRLFGSGADYRALFAEIQGMKVHGAGGGGQGNPNRENAGTSNTTEQVLSKAERYQLADKLANNIADLSAAQKISFEDVAKKLGLKLSDLGKDLGLDNQGLQEYLKVLASDNFGFTDLSGLISEQVSRIIAAITGVNSGFVDPMQASGGKISPPPVAKLPYTYRSNNEESAGIKREISGLRSDVQRLLEPIADNTGRTASGVNRISERDDTQQLAQRTSVTRRSSFTR